MRCQVSLSPETVALFDAAFAARDRAAQSAKDRDQAAAAVTAAQQTSDRANLLATADASAANDAKSAALAAADQELSAPPSPTAKPRTAPAMPAAARTK